MQGLGLLLMGSIRGLGFRVWGVWGFCGFGVPLKGLTLQGFPLKRASFKGVPLTGLLLKGDLQPQFVELDKPHPATA